MRELLQVKSDFLLLKIVFFIVFGANVVYSQSDSLSLSIKNVIKEATIIRYKNIENSVNFLKEKSEKHLKEGDTIGAIKILMEIGVNNSHGANYNKAYDFYWKALLLADEINNKELKALLFVRIGRLYSFYRRKDIAIDYLNNSLEIRKNLIKKGIKTSEILVENYYEKLKIYRELNEFDNAKKCLDSCLIFYNDSSIINRKQIQVEEAVLLSEDHNLEQAEDLLLDAIPWFRDCKPSYGVLVNSCLGDIYAKKNDLSNSRYFYEKALEISKKYNAHIDFTPLIYEKLAKISLRNNNFYEAYLNTEMAKKLDAQFFDSRSENNRPLLEIKDAFRIEKKNQAEILKEQEFKKHKHNDEILLLHRVILVIIVISTLIIGFVYLWSVKVQHKIEKRIIKKNKKKEINKANETLELRNKELASFALQLAEKDEFLRQLKSKLKTGKDDISISEIKKLTNSITISNVKSWQEFKLRFTSVNDKFYKKLTTNYPNLSQRDQKICALIKLNISSKKMASLLGISVESVHTIRYRLRKKLGISSEINLEDFICSL
ncbi:tetratricopeptide repeat protein [Lutibacter citreus]|uniref:tetratricopeptide repeat protein n=1 Tax=Lutibacter citreus TaxID=2138210 RepID=UPI000DBE05BD|nr:hypothetical protein [Lutibacter citreus]